MSKAIVVVLILFAVASISNCKSGPSTASMEEGKKVYVNNCLGCHMEDGKGVPRMNPPLVNSAYVMGDAGNLINLVLLGSDFFGNSKRGFNNQMASFRSLSDQQIADLLTYVRNTYAATGDEIKQEQVKNARAKLN